MQSRALDRDSANLHRVEHGVGIERSGPSDADCNIEESGARFARLELKRDRPARVARDDAQPFLQREIVDLDDHAVDLVIELVAPLLPLPAVDEHLVERGRALDVRINRKAERFEPAQRFPLRTRVLAGNELIGKKREATPRGQRRVELADAARSGIAGVGKEW